MKPVKTTLVWAIFGSLLALAGCSADVGTSDPSETTATTGDPSSDPGGNADGQKGGGGWGQGAQTVQGLHVGQPNNNREQGAPSEEPQPNPWIGGNSGGANQAPAPSNHGVTAAVSQTSNAK